MILAVHRSGGIEEPHRISIDPDDRKSLSVKRANNYEKANFDENIKKSPNI